MRVLIIFAMVSGVVLFRVPFRFLVSNDFSILSIVLVFNVPFFRLVSRHFSMLPFRTGLSVPYLSINVFLCFSIVSFVRIRPELPSPPSVLL